MKTNIKVTINISASYPHLQETQSIRDQLDLAVNQIVSQEKWIPTLYTMEDDRMLDERYTVKHQGSGSVTIAIERGKDLVGKRRFDELADDF